MKKYLVLSVTLLLVVLVVSSCLFKKPDSPKPTIRMTFEEIREGAFTGGQLVYSANDLINHLAPGVLIPIMDITYGWIKLDGSDDYVYGPLSTIYGYLYLVEVSSERLLFDYLAYDENGSIIENLKEVELQVDSPIGQKVFESPGLRGIRFEKAPSVNASRALQGAFLLSFPREEPSEYEQMYFTGEETYNTVLFRIQKSPNNYVRYKGGVITATGGDSPRLVANTGYLTVHEIGYDYIDLVRANDLPPLSPDDYIVSPERVLRILEVEPSGHFNRYRVEEAPLLDAYGTVIMNASGDLESLVLNHGSEENVRWLASVKDPGKEYTFIDYEKTLNIFSSEVVSVDLELSLLSGVDVELNFVAHDLELSTNGHLYFINDFSLKLLLESVGILSQSFEKELYNPKIEFNIDGVPVVIQCPIMAEATIDLPDSSIKLGGGPWFKSKLGFWWDVGCRLTFKLKFIPWPKFWAHAGGVSDFDCGFDLVKPDVEGLLDPVEAEFGLSLNPGIVLATVINPYFKFAGMFDNILDLVGSKSYDLFFHIYGDFIIGLKIPFIGHHDFKLGRLFDKKWKLYSYSFVEIDEHSKWSANLNSLPQANSTPAVDENGSIYLGTENGRLLAYNASGNKSWERQTELNSEFSPILDGHNRLYAASGNVLHIFNSQTGDEIDNTVLGDGDITAAAIGEEPSGCIVMYCGNDNGSIYTHRIGGAGNPAWSDWAADDFSSPKRILSIVIDNNGTVYAAAEDAGLYAIDRETGQTKWHKKWPGQAANTVVVDDENTVLVTVGSVLCALDATTGLELWNRQVLLDSSRSGPVIANDGTIYAGGSKLSALSPEGELLWEYDCGSNIENTPLIGSDGVIYVGTQNGKVCAVNSDGTEKWEFPALVNIGAIASSPSMTIDGTLYVTSYDSRLYAIKTESQGLANSPWPKRNLNDSNTSGNYVPSSLVITQNPESKVVMKGTNTTLSVTADLGSPPYSYQWMKDGSMIMEETGKDLTISGLLPADEGYYWAEVYDSSLPRRKILESEKAYLEVNSNDIGEKKWTFQIGDPDNGATLTASPMLSSRGYLFAVSTEGVLFVIKENGETMEKFEISDEPIEIYGSPSFFETTTYDADFIYAASTDGVVHAVKWYKHGWLSNDWTSEKLGPIHSSPSIDPAGTVYVTCSDLYALVGLNAYYGTKTLEYVAPGYYSSSPAIADDGTIYFASNNSKNFSAIYSDGSQWHHKWNYETQAGVISSPAIGNDGTIYFASVDGTFYALRPDGMERWTYKIPGKQQAVVTSSPVVSGNGAVYIGTNDGKLYSLGIDGTLRWVFDTDGGISSTPVIGNDGVIYLATMGGTIHAIDESGSELWRLDYGDGFTASPVIGNGIVYFGTNHGKIVAVNCSSNGLDSGPWPKYKKDNFNSGRQ